MSLGLLTLHLRIPGCSSLKEKRSRIKPLIARLHREFNVSVAEMDHLDVWQNTRLGIATVSNAPEFTTQSLQKIAAWIDKYWPDVEIIEQDLITY